MAGKDFPAKLASGANWIKARRFRGYAPMSTGIYDSTSTAAHYHDLIIALCVEAGFSPLIRHEARLWQTVVTMIGFGMGIALVPGTLRRAENDKVSYVPLKRNEAMSQLLFLRRAGEEVLLIVFSSDTASIKISILSNILSLALLIALYTGSSARYFNTTGPKRPCFERKDSLAIILHALAAFGTYVIVMALFARRLLAHPAARQGNGPGLFLAFFGALVLVAYGIKTDRARMFRETALLLFRWMTAPVEFGEAIRSYL